MSPRNLWARWSRSRGIDPEPYASWRGSLSERPGRPARVLAWAATGGSTGGGPTVGDSAERGLVVLSPAALSVLQVSPEGTAADGWQHLGWHEIERGGWNAETAQLRWQTYEGRRGAIGLPDPERVPAVFKERVDASIVFEQFVPLVEGSDRGVVVSGRRDLADGAGPIDWHTTLTRGVSWRTPGVREVADRALAEVRFEYDER